MKTPVVLSADDSENDHLLLERARRKNEIPFKLQWVEDGQEVIDYLSGAGRYADRALFPMPVLVLLDLKMPRMGGLEALDWIKQQPDFKERLPVAVFTSSRYDSDVNRVYQRGADWYLVKPLEYDELSGLLQAIHRQITHPNEDALTGSPLCMAWKNVSS
jgi:CheY-like chemotaxis protein